MKKDFILPQGKFKVGRDIPEGVYLIASLSDLTCFMHVNGEGGKYERYALDEDDGLFCHVELEKGDVFTVSSRIKVRRVTKFISDGEEFNLLDEIEDFKQSIPELKKNTKAVEEEKDDDSDDDCEIESSTDSERKVGFWAALGELFANTASHSSSSKKHSGRCDGDCANCPPHYGYRHGRWYYGHDHIEGCEFGGNKGSGSRD